MATYVEIDWVTGDRLLNALGTPAGVFWCACIEYLYSCACKGERLSRSAGGYEAGYVKGTGSCRRKLFDNILQEYV